MAGHTKMVYPETVTHPSINRARRRITILIETNALPLSQAITFHNKPCQYFSVTDVDFSYSFIFRLLCSVNMLVTVNTAFSVTVNLNHIDGHEKD